MTAARLALVSMDRGREASAYFGAKQALAKVTPLECPARGSGTPGTPGWRLMIIHPKAKRMRGVMTRTSDRSIRHAVKRQSDGQKCAWAVTTFQSLNSGRLFSRAAIPIHCEGSRFKGSCLKCPCWTANSHTMQTPEISVAKTIAASHFPRTAGGGGRQQQQQ